MNKLPSLVSFILVDRDSMAEIETTNLEQAIKLSTNDKISISCLSRSRRVVAEFDINDDEFHFLELDNGTACSVYVPRIF